MRTDIMYDRMLKLLTENHISASKLAKELGFSPATMSDWKRGRTTPKADKLQAIADYFNVSLDWLLGNSDIREVKTKDGYYTDPEVAKLANEIKNDPDLRILLDAKRSLSQDDMNSIINITKSLLQKERGE